MHYDVVGAHGDEIDADGGVDVALLRDPQFGTYAVGAEEEGWCVGVAGGGEVEGTAEAADEGGGAGAGGGGNEGGNGGDKCVASGDGDAGGGVGEGVLLHFRCFW